MCLVCSRTVAFVLGLTSVDLPSLDLFGRFSASLPSHLGETGTFVLRLGLCRMARATAVQCPTPSSTRSRVNRREKRAKIGEASLGVT